MADRPPISFGLLLTAVHDRSVPVDRQISEHRDLVARARDLDFDVVLAGQHFATPELRFLQPVPYLSSLAAAAGPMGVGTGIALLPLLNPVDVAEQMATLDAISGGRAVFGAGIGYKPEEFEMFGVDRRTRARRFDEALGILRTLWQGGTVSGEFEFFSVDGATLSIAPLQDGGIPIWVGGQADASVRRAALLGDGWYAPPFPSHKELSRLARSYRRIGEEAGRPRGQVSARREIFVTGGPPEHEQAFWSGVGERFEVFRAWGEDASADPGASEVGSPSWQDSTLIVGSVDECVDGIRWLRENADLDRLIIKVQWPGVPHEVSLAQIELLGSEVLPRLKES